MFDLKRLFLVLFSMVSCTAHANVLHCLNSGLKRSLVSQLQAERAFKRPGPRTKDAAQRLLKTRKRKKIEESNRSIEELMKENGVKLPERLILRESDSSEVIWQKLEDIGAHLETILHRKIAENLGEDGPHFRMFRDPLQSRQVRKRQHKKEMDLLRKRMTEYLEKYFLPELIR